jgi:hypothetical protein
MLETIYKSLQNTQKHAEQGSSSERRFRRFEQVEHSFSYLDSTEGGIQNSYFEI